MEKQGEIREGLTPPETENKCCGNCLCKESQEESLEGHLTKRIADKTTECKTN